MVETPNPMKRDAEAPPNLVRPIESVSTHWTYKPSFPSIAAVRHRIPARWTRRPFPASRVLKKPLAAGNWILYFIFLPNGALTAAHRFTLDRLARESASLMIVCACPEGHPVVEALGRQCDALCWKSLDGYDFSGYSVGLHTLARECPGSNVFVMNDSMLGPFCALTPFIELAPWRLTGLTASSLEENHLQSFSLIVRGLDSAFLDAVAPVISDQWCYHTAGAVILLQETRLARVASRSMTVGAFWYTDGSRYRDLTLFCPEQLLDAGFPLLKKSLFGKFAGVFQPPETMQALLQWLGHPPLPAPST